MLDRINFLLSNNLHNYIEVFLLILEGVCVIGVLLFPNQIRLEMARDVGGLVAMMAGIIGGVHGWKAVTKIGASPKDDPC